MTAPADSDGGGAAGAGIEAAIRRVRSLVAVGHYAWAVGVADDDLVDHVEEQAVLDDADRVDQVLGEILRVVDALKMQVHDEVVLVGAHFLAVGVEAQHRLVVLGLELLDDVAGAAR